MRWKALTQSQFSLEVDAVNGNTKMNADEIVEMLNGIAPHIEVSSHIPGKIELKVSFSALGHMRTSDWTRLESSVPGILGTQVKLFSRSVVIEYDRDRLPYELWEALLQLRDKPKEQRQVSARLRQLLES